MTTLQKFGYASVASMFAVTQTFAAINFGKDKVADGIKGSPETADTAIQVLIGNFMLFLGIIAVCYGLWGGFQIVTAGGEEEKVKKGRTIITQVAIGLVIIFLANSIVQFVLTKILTSV